MDDVRAFPAPPQPKTMRETKYLDPKASHEKKIFLQKMFSHNIFHFFRHLNISISTSGNVSVPTTGTNEMRRTSTTTKRPSRTC